VDAYAEQAEFERALECLAAGESICGGLTPGCLSGNTLSLVLPGGPYAASEARSALGVLARELEAAGGLVIVDRIASRWGTDQRGRSVWFELEPNGRRQATRSTERAGWAAARSSLAATTPVPVCLAA
jgi:hypothetical protein